MRTKVHIVSAEVLVTKVHVVAFLDKLDHFAELIHVKLADEGGEVFVSEKVRKHFIL